MQWLDDFATLAPWVSNVRALRPSLVRPRALIDFHYRRRDITLLLSRLSFNPRRDDPADQDVEASQSARSTPW